MAVVHFDPEDKLSRWMMDCHFQQLGLRVKGHEVDIDGGSVPNVRHCLAGVRIDDVFRVDTQVEDGFDFGLLLGFVVCLCGLTLLIRFKIPWNSTKAYSTLDAQSNPSPRAAKISRTTGLGLHLTA